MKLKVDDKVKVIFGKDKGKVGKVVRIDRQKDTVLVEGVNKVKKHVKPGAVSKEGGIVSIERPLHISNVMYFDEKAKQTTRIGYKLEKGKKVRISKKSGSILN